MNFVGFRAQIIIRDSKLMLKLPIRASGDFFKILLGFFIVDEVSSVAIVLKALEIY